MVSGDVGLFDLAEVLPARRAPVAVKVDSRPRTVDGRIVRRQRCACCGARTFGGLTYCRFCAIEDCGGACGPLYGPLVEVPVSFRPRDDASDPST